MEIKPKEVESIKTIGKLYGEDVKLVKTVGGLNIIVGKKSKNGKKDSPLAAGSHQGIAIHQVEKQFGNDFQPSMFKSEHESLEHVEEKTTYLPSDVVNSGVELYTIIKNSQDIDFVVCKHGLTIGKYETSVEQSKLVIKNYSFDKAYSKLPTKKALAKAMMDKLKELGLDEVVNGR